MSTRERDTIRTFVAIELDDDTKAHIASAIETLRQKHIDNLRPVRSEGVHLTLKFLGDIEVSQVTQVADAMKHAASQQTRFSLTLGTPGVFPSTNRARVLWIGLDGEIKALKFLQAEVETALISVGFAAERQRSTRTSRLAGCTTGHRVSTGSAPLTPYLHYDCLQIRRSQ